MGKAETYVLDWLLRHHAAEYLPPERARRLRWPTYEHGQRVVTADTPARDLAEPVPPRRPRTKHRARLGRAWRSQEGPQP